MRPPDKCKDRGVVDSLRLTGGDEGYTSEEVVAAVESLVQRGWISQETEQGQIRLPSTGEEGACRRVAEVYRFLLTGRFRPRVLGCPYYDEHINEQLVEEIQQLQAGLPLSSDDVTEAIRLLRLSPGALAWALHPQELLVTQRSRPERAANQSDVDIFDQNYFFTMLYRLLLEDFLNPGLIRYFHQVRGLRELETTQAIAAKSATGTEGRL